MNETKPTQKAADYANKLANSTSRRWAEATLTTGLITGGLGLLGLWIDNQIGSKPILLIVGLVIALPLSIYITYIRLKKN